MEQAEKEAEASNAKEEKKRQKVLSESIDANAERKRISSLHSLLDKTAVYSKFVSSQIKDVGLATIQGQQQGTGEAASSGKKAKAQTNAAPCHGIITTPDLLLARLQGAKGGGKNTEGKYEGQSKYITGGEQRDYQKQGTLSFRRPLAALSFRRQF